MRIDAVGAIHHIVIRGIERRRIFYNDADKNNFTEQLRNIICDTQTACLGWSLLPNDAHLLLRTGLVPLPTVMRRLLTGGSKIGR